MKCCLSVFLALLLCCLAAGAQAETVVGPDIAKDDIVDFYYTVDAPLAMSVYLRYRFYAEDGKKLFYHESRQGGAWPQTEEDTVASGTVELTDAEWAAFYECLRGGAVHPRSDDVLDGDDGPWMYLYWTGDEGANQVFTFASYGKQAEFNALCSRLAQNHFLTWFSFCRGGDMAPQSYEVFLRNGSYFILENDDEIRPFDQERTAELRQVIAEYDLESWDGFHKSNPYVLDGESFTLEMRYADGEFVYASGDNAFPDHYFDVADRLNAVFEREKRSHLAGTYRYEGAGLGGDFTITLHADGTYVFYEGPLSSYLGGGTWNYFGNAIYLTEENGLDLQFMFGVDKDALIYLEMGSDPFPYVHLSDEERLIRLEAAEENMKLMIGDREVPVIWEENDSVAALRALLPLTVPMSMYGGFEQVGPIGRSLPRDDRQTTTAAGDIVLYSGNQIVVFYGSNSWAYTRLGHIGLSQEEMAELLSHGDVTLTLTK